MLSLWNLCKIYDKNQRFWLSFKQTSNKATFATRYQLHTKKTTLWSWNGFNWFMRSNPVSASDNSLVIFSSYLLMSNYRGRLIHCKINELIFYKQLLNFNLKPTSLGYIRDSEMIQHWFHQSKSSFIKLKTIALWFAFRKHPESGWNIMIKLNLNVY